MGTPPARSATASRRATSASTLVPSKGPTMFRPPRLVVPAARSTRAESLRVGPREVVLPAVEGGVPVTGGSVAPFLLVAVATPSVGRVAPTSADSRVGASRPISSSEASLAVGSSAPNAAPAMSTARTSWKDPYSAAAARTLTTGSIPASSTDRDHRTGCGESALPQSGGPDQRSGQWEVGSDTGRSSKRFEAVGEFGPGPVQQDVGQRWRLTEDPAEHRHEVLGAQGRGDLRRGAFGLQKPVHQFADIGLEHAVGSDGTEHDIRRLAKATERCQGLAADGRHHVGPIFHAVVVSPSARDPGEERQAFSCLTHGKASSSLGDVSRHLAPRQPSQLLQSGQRLFEAPDPPEDVDQVGHRQAPGDRVGCRVGSLGETLHRLLAVPGGLQRPAEVHQGVGGIDLAVVKGRAGKLEVPVSLVAIVEDLGDVPVVDQPRARQVGGPQGPSRDRRRPRPARAADAAMSSNAAGTSG